MMNKMDERILCLRANAVDSACKLGLFDDKVFKIPYEVLEHLLKHSEIHRRGDVEENIIFKQVIPYGILLQKTPDGEKVRNRTCLSYKRTKSGGDGRLYNLYSIGFGGHMREGELPIDGLCRELNEELKYDGQRFRFGEYIRRKDCCFGDDVYVINDNSTPVNSVHFGIVFPVYIDLDKVEANEDTISEIERVNINDLANDCDKYESWSQLVINLYAYELGSTVDLPKEDTAK